MTIKDLARETGYSVGTISRVLNGQPNVSERARKTILACVERSGFQLNSNAKLLKQQRGDGFLAVVTGRSNELFSRMLEHLRSELSLTSGPLTIDYVDETENAVDKAVQLCLEKKPRGVFFLGGDMYNFPPDKLGLPAVVLTSDASGLGLPNISSVTTDDLAAADCAVRYLLERGHRDIGVITGGTDCSGPSRLRLEGCRRAFAREGLSLRPELCVKARYSFAGGYAAANELLARGGVTAIFAVSDAMAIGAVSALHAHGLRVPEDVSVIGFDGLEVGAYYLPPLTTIGQQVELLVRRGVQLMRSAVEQNAPARHETVPFRLIERGSVSNREHFSRKDDKLP